MNGTKYPLLFTYNDLVAGNGFVAGVTVKGSSLMVAEEDGDVWIYGVQPGGFSSGGRSQKEAASAFRSMYRAVLFDLAAEAEGFKDFRWSIEELFNQVSESLFNEWNSAVDEVRQGRVNSDWLQQLPAESAREVLVVELAKPKPEDNQLEELELAA